MDETEEKKQPLHPTQPPTSVLIIGAGELGTAILSSLISHPSYSPSTTALAVLRRASTLTSADAATQSELSRLRALGVSSEAGDFVAAPQAELVAIFKRYDVVIQAAGYGTPPGTLLRVAQAAVTAGVRRFFPWQFGVDYQAVADQGGEGGLEASGHSELFGEMLAVRKMLKEQRGTGWTVVSTGLFMSFLFLREFGVVDLQGRVVRGLGSWGNKVTVTDVAGIGSMVAEVVYSPGETNNKVVYVAGDTVSYREVADTVEAVFGPGFKREEWDREFLARRLEEHPGDLMLKYQNAFASGVGVSWEMERTLNHQRGIKLTDLRQYAEDNKARLASLAA